MSTSNDIITRCPECATAFRATKEILSLAGGTVRCGSCLRVFDAKIHAITQVERPKKSRSTTPSTHNRTLQQAEEATRIDHFTASSPSSQQKRNKTDSSKAKKEPYFTLVDPPQNNTNASGTTLSAPEEKHTEKPNNNTSFNNDEIPSLQLNPIEVDHLALEEREESTPFPWGSLLGACIMGALLATQVAWLRFDTLSTRASYQPYYAAACKLLGCTHYQPHNIKQIHTTQLVVRSHPDHTKALLVDAIMINSAGFEQPYPGLRLTFLDIHGGVVASRDLQPEDYLRGELIGASIIPVNQPIQLSLAIVDPGENAVNYHINVIAPKDEK